MARGEIQALRRGRLSRLPALRERGGVVKSVKMTCKGVLVSALVLMAVSAWAESKGSLGLQHPTNVAGKTLATGDYTVRWDGQGDQVDVKIYKGKNVVASVPARIVQLSSPAGSNSAVVSNDSNGTSSLAEIRFGGKKMALRIAGDGSGSSSSGASK